MEKIVEVIEQNMIYNYEGVRVGRVAFIKG